MSSPPLRVSAGSGVPFYRQIVDQLSALISAGQLAPGQRLPSVRELAKELVVSLITVRRAYADLEHAGLIQRRQGQGTFVADQVDTKSRERARRESYRTLLEAIERARHLGVDDEEIRAFVLQTLDQPSNAPWRL